MSRVVRALVLLTAVCTASLAEPLYRYDFEAKSLS